MNGRRCFWGCLASFIFFCGCAEFESIDVGVDSGPDSGLDAGGDAAVDAGPTDPIVELASRASVELYRGDLETVSIPRPAGSENASTVRGHIADWLALLGYEVELQHYGTGTNVIGKKSGEDPAQVLITAHYDGIAGCPGADDNGSGTAGVLETARILSEKSFKKTLVLAFFDEEESGLLGSEAYAKRAKERGEDISVAFNMDMIGYMSEEENSQLLPTGLDLLFPDQAEWLKKHKYKGDFIIYCFDDSARRAGAEIEHYSKEFGLLSIAMELTQGQKKSDLLAPLRAGDHASFWMQDYPSMMINDSNEYRKGNPYHCKSGLVDSTDKVNTDFAIRIVKSTTAAAAKLLEMK